MTMIYDKEIGNAIKNLEANSTALTGIFLLTPEAVSSFPTGLARRAKK